MSNRNISRITHNGVVSDIASYITHNTLAALSKQQVLGAVSIEEKLGTGFITSSAVLARSHAYVKGSFYFGFTIEDNLIRWGEDDPELHSVPLGNMDKGHILVCAETQSGKSERLLVGNLGLWSGSALVIDCKGMLARMTAEARGPGKKYHCDGMGQDVSVLDPERITGVPEELQATLNPIDWIDPDDDSCILKARILAEGLLPDEATEQRNDPYWPDEGREFLALLIAHVATDPDIPDEQRNLNYVYTLVQAGELKLKQDLIELGALGEEEIDSEISGYTLLFKAMQANPSFRHYISTQSISFEDLFDEARKQFEGIRSQAAGALRWLAQPAYRRNMEKSSCSFADLKTKPNGATIYLSIKEMRHNWRWVRLMVNIFAVESQVMVPPATGYPTLAILDEFSSLRSMPEIEALLDRSAEYATRMVVVVQRLEQLQKTYPKSWQQFWSAASLRWLFGVECPVTAKFLEELLGDVEISRYTLSLANSYVENEAETDTHSETFNKSQTTGGSTSQTNSSNKSKGTTKSKSGSESVDLSHNHGQTVRGAIFGNLYDNSLLHPGSKGQRRGYSISDNTGSSDQETEGFSNTSSDNYSDTNGQAIGDTHSKMTGSSKSTTPSITEGKHKRAMIQRNIVPYLTARVDDPRDPRFPGQALVSLRGGVTAFVRTQPFYRNPLFYRTYAEHPLYPFQQTPLPWDELKALEKREAEIEAELHRRFEPERQKLAEIAADAKRLLAHQKHQQLLLEQKKIIEKAAGVWKKCFDIANSHRSYLSVDVPLIPEVRGHLPTDADLKAQHPLGHSVEYGDPLLQLKSGYAILQTPLNCRVVHATRDYSGSSSDVSRYDFTLEASARAVRKAVELITASSVCQHELHRFLKSGMPQKITELRKATPLEKEAATLDLVKFKADLDRELDLSEECFVKKSESFCKSLKEYHEHKFSVAVPKYFRDFGEALIGEDGVVSFLFAGFMSLAALFWPLAFWVLWVSEGYERAHDFAWLLSLSLIVFGGLLLYCGRMDKAEHPLPDCLKSQPLRIVDQEVNPQRSIAI